MKRKEITVGGLMMILIAMLFAVVFAGACNGHFDRDDDDKDHANGAPSAGQATAQISFENGQAILMLDQQAQTRMGIDVAVLKPTVTQPEIDVPAVVLSVQDLATFRNGYIAILSQIEKDRASISVARNEYNRLKSLFDRNQDVSEKSLQEAEGSLRSLEADENAAEQQLNLQTSIAEQQWGEVVAMWAVDGSPELARVLSMRQVLLQVTLPFDQSHNGARMIAVEIPGRSRTQAEFVSPFPRVDPRIQGRSFLYAASAGPDLSPGVNLIAHVSVGRSMKGVIVPASAIVWSEGRAWAYVQTASNQLSRREVPTDIPRAGGYFTSSAAFLAGSRIVRQGAQSLLSEELILQGYGGGGDTDDD